MPSKTKIMFKRKKNSMYQWHKTKTMTKKIAYKIVSQPSAETRNRWPDQALIGALHIVS